MPGSRASTGAAAGGAPGGAGRVAVAAHTRAEPQSRALPPAPGTTPAEGQPAPGAAAPPATPLSTPRAWHKQRRRATLAHARDRRIGAAQEELARTRIRLTLVRQGAVVGAETTAQAAVAVAERRVASMVQPRSLRPSAARATRQAQPTQPRMRHHQRRLERSRQWRYKPGMAHIAGLSSPAPVMVQEVGQRNAALTVNAAGYAAPVPLPQDAPPPEHLVVPAADVRDLDGLLQAGYQVYQPPQSDAIIIWPHPDTPGVHWIAPGTPNARPDLVRERHRLGRQGLIAMSRPPQPMRPHRLHTRHRQRASRGTGAHRRKNNP